MLSNPDTFTLLIPAFAGGIIGKLCRLPGGALLFSTVSVAVTANYWDLSHQPPFEMIVVLQLLMGCMLGQSINRRFWQDLLQIWRPCLMVLWVYSLAAVPFAALLVYWFGFDLLTAALAATPARMQDMIVLASTMNGDAVTVMLMQLVRQFVIIGVTPFMLAEYVRDGASKRAAAASGAKLGGHNPFAPVSWRKTLWVYVVFLVPAALGAFLGMGTGHVLGPLLGAFVLVGLSRVIWLKVGELPFPKPFAFIVQCLAGVLLGSRITPEIDALLLERAVPLIAAAVYVLGAGLLIARILQRRYGWHKGLSWMSGAPGRLSDMLAISQDIELSSKERLALASVHTVRQIYFTVFISVMTAFF